MKERSLLVQKSGCKGCSLARKEEFDKGGQLIITKEICRHGGRIAVEEGSATKFSCSQ